MNTKAITLMFIGAVLIAIFLFVDMNISFSLWATGFIISMLVAFVGIVIALVSIIKSM